MWEAFVSGTNKSPAQEGRSKHAADAAAAAETFRDRWPHSLTTDVTCPEGGFNLAAAAAIYAGLDIHAEEIRQGLTVLRTTAPAQT